MGLVSLTLRRPSTSQIGQYRSVSLVMVDMVYLWKDNRVSNHGWKMNSNWRLCKVNEEEEWKMHSMRLDKKSGMMDSDTSTDFLEPKALQMGTDHKYPAYKYQCGTWWKWQTFSTTGNWSSFQTWSEVILLWSGSEKHLISSQKYAIESSEKRKKKTTLFRKMN